MGRKLPRGQRVSPEEPEGMKQADKAHSHSYSELTWEGSGMLKEQSQGMVG